MKELTVEERMRRVTELERRILKVQERMTWRRAERKIISGFLICELTTLGLVVYSPYIQDITVIGKLISDIIACVLIIIACVLEVLLCLIGIGSKKLQI